MTLEQTAVTTLKGVGAAVRERLAQLGVTTLQDLLFHLPYRYQDRTRLTRIGALVPGTEAVIAGEVVVAEVVQRRRRALLVRLADGTGSLTIRFFHFSRTQVQQFERGARVECFGEVRRGPLTLEMVHPEYRVGSQDSLLRESLTPFYPATEGLQQPGLRRLSDQVLARLDELGLDEWLPADLPETRGLPSLCDALRTAHRPPADVDVTSLLDGTHPALRRLALEELVSHRLALARLREAARRFPAPVVADDSGLRERLRDSLPFALTGAQSRALDTVLDDMASGRPMLRLVQGDVGSGKTVVAALAAAAAVDAGCQVALMAPTEVLAEQHFLSFEGWFRPLDIEVAWLTGKLRANARRSTLESIASGRARIVVGTHALFQADVRFDRLGLAIIDEQHRFGVHQRMALRDKGGSADSASAPGETVERPHQLIMTATPIPRTLAMTAYADLDSAVIDELPPGREPVKTVALDADRRDELIERVATVLDTGRQAYWVCTLIEDSESLQAEAAAQTHARLCEVLDRHRVGLVHGRLHARDKEAVMHAFKSGAIDLLVATTVIEVGVDVPNATLMIIENAERLGLSQLHQLRGRVGRGTAESSCILLYQPPLSATARERLGILRDTNDGFRIAEKDLELRGAGEVLGTRQTGLAEFRVADLDRDADLFDTVIAIADRLQEAKSANVEALIRRWIGSRDVYGSV